MALGLTNYGENLALNILMGGTAKLATVYIALMFTEPAESVTGTGLDEPSAGAYARVSKTVDVTNWPNASSGVKRNGTDVIFPTATADWGSTTLKFFAICDAASAGNVILVGKLATARRIYSGMTPRFDANSLSITAD